MERYREILDFWFGQAAGPKLWFGASPDADRQVRERFSGDHADAVASRLRSWEDSAQSCVALVVLLDQFSMQLHRKQRQGYEQAALALPIAERAIARGFDGQVTHAERGFLYMPFMHAEDRALQDRSLELFTRLAEAMTPEERGTLQGFLDSAKQHRDIVQRYGRFPGRNHVFGRDNTAEEQAYLDRGGYF
ncbi:MAG TPA: DUF924 family protein [Gammaproteobacteria bacterium]|jgi:uncharacterized protein (DUF924 family)